MRNVEEIFRQYCSNQELIEDYDFYFLNYELNNNGEVIALELFDSEYWLNFPIKEKLGEFIGEFKKLKRLEIQINYFLIKDLSPLSDLYELEDIMIQWSTEIRDIEFVRNMTNLKSLYLHSSKVKSIDALKDKKQLISVGLPFAQIEDISALDGLTELTWINFSNNKIKNVDSLKQCQKLQSFTFRNNQISNIEAFSNLHELTSIDIANNNIADLSPIQHLTKLSSISAPDNKISNIDFLYKFDKLTFLQICNNEIKNADVLANCHQLTKLYIADNLIENIDFVANNLFLKDLTISNNPIKSIQSLNHLEKLENLYLANLPMVDFEKDFANKSELIRLDLSNCNLKTIKFLSNQTQLFELNLSNNQLSDYSELNNFYKLYNLNLQNNQIQGVFPIYYFLKLGAVDLRGNEFGDKLFGKFSNYTRIFDAKKTDSEGTIVDLEKLVADDYLKKGDIEAALAFHYYNKVVGNYINIYKSNLVVSLYYLKHLFTRNSPFIYNLRRRIIGTIESIYNSNNEKKIKDYYIDIVLNINKREVDILYEELYFSDLFFHHVKYGISKFRDEFIPTLNELMQEEKVILSNPNFFNFMDNY